MTPPNLAIVLGLATTSLAALQVPAPAPATGLVLVDVVVERGNNVVLGLSRNDFEVASDSGPRPIEFFSAGDEPVTVALLVDVTVSTRAGRVFGAGTPSALDRGSETLLEAFAAGLGPSDRALVGAIAGRVVLSRRFTADKDELLAAARDVLAVPGVDTFGPSPIWDASDAVVTVLAREPGRRALVVWTDGMATGNVRSVKDAAARATAAGVSVHILAAGGDDVPLRAVSPRVALEWIAGETGGVYAIDRGGNPKPVLARIFNGLRHAYTLGFAGDRDGKPHRLVVRVKKGGLKVRVRKWYLGS